MRRQAGFACHPCNGLALGVAIYAGVAGYLVRKLDQPGSTPELWLMLLLLALAAASLLPPAIVFIVASIGWIRDRAS